MKLKRHLLIFLSIIFLLFSCSDDKYPAGYTYPDLNPGTKGELLEYEKVTTMSKTDIQNFLQKAADSFQSEDGEDGINMFSILGMLKNGVTIYKAFYTSESDGEPIVLSGLVLAPDIDSSFTQYQYHHGTLLPYEIDDVGGLLDAPSQFEGKVPEGMKEQIETMFFCLIPAANGYFVSAPDYPGYGISAYEEHPYCYPPDLDRTSADMVKASQELADKISLELNGKTFLTGVSEGGLVSLITHRFIDNERPSTNVVASFNYAGPYNLSRFFQEFITADGPLPALNLYNWALYSYWKRNQSLFENDIWIYEVKDQEDALDVPSQNPGAILNHEFINSVMSDSSELVNEINKIDIYSNWEYKGKIFLHHGKDDQTVPAYNTEDAYQYLLDNGANVEKYLYEGNHQTAIFNFFSNMTSDLRYMDNLQYYASEY
ncbi:MAG TPA: hypothetical protein VKP78_11760 [bacterium]|nr:hypothetical protein [bacterium]